jgi:hypothetical protein
LYKLENEDLDSPSWSQLDTEKTPSEARLQDGAVVGVSFSSGGAHARREHLLSPTARAGKFRQPELLAPEA